MSTDTNSVSDASSLPDTNSVSDASSLQGTDSLPSTDSLSGTATSAPPVPHPRPRAIDARSSSGKPPGSSAMRARRRLWSVCGWGLGTALLGAVFVHVSLGVGMDSDAANKALQGWDLLHGNLLLRHWITGDATFYALESPLYGLVEAFTGLCSLAAHVVPAVTYLLVLGFVLALSRGTATGRSAALRMLTGATILLIPLASPYGVSLLMEQPDHVGTAAFLLAVFLLAERADSLRPWVAPAGILVLCTLGILSDDTVTYVAVPSLALVCGIRSLVLRRPLGRDAAMAMAALAAPLAEHIVRDVMHKLNGYWMTRPATALSAPALWWNHSRRTAYAVLALFGVFRAESSLFAVLAAVGVLAAAVGFVRALYVLRRGSGRAELLCATGIVLNLAMYTLSTGHTPIPAHEVAAVLPFGAVLAARCVSPAWSYWRSAARRVSVALVAVAVAPLAVSSLRPPQPPIPTAPPPALVSWLSAHDLHYGIAGYWDASTLTVDSGGGVVVRAVVRSSSTLSMYGWETRTDWYSAHMHDATFVVAYDGPARFGLIDADKLSSADFEHFLGTPSAVYRVDGRTVLVYLHGNILDHVRAWLPPLTKRS